MRVVAGERGQEEGVVVHSAGDGAEVVEGLRKGEDAVLADPAEGRFHAHGAAEGRGYADGAGGIGTECRVAEPRRYRYGGAAAGAAGYSARVEGVPRRPEPGPVSCRAVGELVRVRLAEEDRPALLEPADDRGIRGRNVVFKEGGAHRGTHALGADQVLDADRHAVERASVLSGQDLLLRPRRLLQRILRQHGDEGVELPVDGFDALEERTHDLDRRETALSKSGAEVVYRTRQVFGFVHPPSGPYTVSERARLFVS